MWSKVRTQIFLVYDSAALPLSKAKVTIIFMIFIKINLLLLASHIPPSASNYCTFSTDRQWVTAAHGVTDMVRFSTLSACRIIKAGSAIRHTIVRLPCYDSS